MKCYGSQVKPSRYEGVPSTLEHEMWTIVYNVNKKQAIMAVQQFFRHFVEISFEPMQVIYRQSLTYLSTPYVKNVSISSVLRTKKHTLFL